MKPTSEYYAILEVRRGASYEDVNASYRRSNLLHHLDKDHGSLVPTEKTKLVSPSHCVKGGTGRACVEPLTYPDQRSLGGPKRHGPQE